MWIIYMDKIPPGCSLEQMLAILLLWPQENQLHLTQLSVVPENMVPLKFFRLQWKDCSGRSSGSSPQDVMTQHLQDKGFTKYQKQNLGQAKTTSPLNITCLSVLERGSSTKKAKSDREHVPKAGNRGKDTHAANFFEYFFPDYVSNVSDICPQRKFWN